MADADWSGAASLGPDSGYELGTPSVQSGVGVLTVTVGSLRWVPDEQAVLAGHQPWELIPAHVREIELPPKGVRDSSESFGRAGRSRSTSPSTPVMVW